MSDYGAFEESHEAKILAWRDYYASNYVDMFGEALRTLIVLSRGKKEEGSGSATNSGSVGEFVVNPPPFNPTSRFFQQLHRDYYGQQIR